MPQVKNNNDAKFLYGLLPALPVILAAVVFNWQGEITLLLGVLLTVFGVGCGLFLWHRHVNELEQLNCCWLQDETGKIAAVAAYSNELERLLLTISPILSQHVMVSREHTEQEIISLTSRFAGMVNELRQIVDSTDNALGGQQQFHLDSVVNTSRELLQPVLQTLKKIHQEEHSVAAELQALPRHIAELAAVASEVKNLAGQSDAAKLTENILHINQRFQDQLSVINTAVNAAISLSKNSMQVDDATLLQSETNINHTLSHLSLALSHYRNDVEALRNNAEQIRGEIDNVLVALQFQDRVSQILIQVENNLLNMQKTIEAIQQQGSDRDSNMLQVDAAVEHIEENYKSVSSHPGRTVDASDDLTFF